MGSGDSGITMRADEFHARLEMKDGNRGVTEVDVLHSNIQSFGDATAEATQKSYEQSVPEISGCGLQLSCLFKL